MDTTCYSDIDLVGLIRLVVEESDRKALREIHDNRRIIPLHENHYLLIVEYLDFLKGRAARQENYNIKSTKISEAAYDITLDKLSNLPLNDTNNGPDCRKYFRALLSKIEELIHNNKITTRLRIEAKCCMLTKGLIRRHFSLSCLEALRNADAFWSRYNWHVGNYNFDLRMPSSMTGGQRRIWLEENVPGTILDDPMAKEKIQELIEMELVKERFTSIDSLEYQNSLISQDNFFPVDQDWGLNLAEAVAREKVQNIEKQRPAIRKLGPKSLAELVRQVFLDLDAEDYEQKKVAAKFGLSPATLSRFAGTDWRQKDTKDQQIPDLWRNTAQVVSQIPVFREVAEEAGMLHWIEEVRGDE